MNTDMDGENGACQWRERRGGVETAEITAVIPQRRLNKQVSASLSSSSRPASPSPAPLSSSSSASSTTSSSVAAHQSKRSSKYSITVSSAGDKIGSGDRIKQAITKKSNTNRKWICPKCQGDVRLPPLITAPNDNCDDEIPPEEECLKEALELTTVMCALKCCPAPRYHLTCSGVPKGSQVFRNTIISCQPAGSGAVVTNQDSANKKCDAKRMLEHLYSSSEGIWWGLPTDTKVMIDGKQCSKKSQRALQNDKNWPTSMLSFMCFNCDVEGSSRYLCEYFERFHFMKASFYAEYLPGIKDDGMGDRRDRAEESVEARTGPAFLWHLLNDNQKEYLYKSQAGMEPHFDWSASEIQLKNMAWVLTFLSKELQQQQVQQHQRRQKRQKNKCQLDPSYLVGMPIRLFNPIDNSYHSGRILDYKVDAPYKVDQHLSHPHPSRLSEDSAPDIGHLTDEKICSTLFLIRFRHGVEGRKIAVHQWIYLEEHAVTIGGEVCWANTGNHFGDAKAGGAHDKCSSHGNLKNTGSCTPVLKSDARLQAQKKEHISQYHPVQILFRSMLEMIPFQNLNPLLSDTDSKKSCASMEGEKSMNEDSCLNVLAMGFGQTVSHVRLSFSDSAAKNAKLRQLELIETQRNETQRSAFGETACTATAELAKPVAIPITSSNPRWFDRILLRVQLSDKDVALALAAACMEKEEERRIRTWHHLPVSHLSQPSFNKKNYESISFTAPNLEPSNRPKKRQNMALDDVSLEIAASLGCAKCVKELKTGAKSNRSHDEDCPRRKNFQPVSLEVAASFGCAKCTKELNTGVKTNKAHDQICPRRKKH